MAGDPTNVRVGPGWLKVAPVGATEPAEIDDAWDAAWIDIGYTDAGSEISADASWDDVVVAEELDPILTQQVSRTTQISFAAAEMTARNLQIAFNGGTIGTPGGSVTFEPPGVGDVTRVAIGWESTDGLEKWIFRKCLQVGNVAIPRRRSPDKAVIPMTFRCEKPSGAMPFKVIYSEDYAEIGS